MTGASFARPWRRMRQERPRTQPVWGLCAHTCGGGIYQHANPENWVCDFYTNPRNPFAQYVIWQDGTLIQVACESTRAWHAGIDSDERRLYASGAWQRKVSVEALRLWQAAFPGERSPLDLVPGPDDPNQVYISVELVPGPGLGAYTDAQYEKLALLVRDIWSRYDLPRPQTGTPGADWATMRRVGRLVGHEDLEPLTRWNQRGGWDPGAIHPKPKFSWGHLFSILEAMEQAA